MKNLLFNITKRMPCRIINRDDDAPYLERYFIKELFGWRFYLHRFVNSDHAEEPHDHPWPKAYAFVITGGYWENRFNPMNGELSQRFVHRFNKILGSDFHAIISPMPETWTLFCHGPRVKPWGFLKRTINGKLWREDMTESSEGWEHEVPLGKDAPRQPLKNGAAPGK